MGGRFLQKLLIKGFYRLHTMTAFGSLRVNDNEKNKVRFGGYNAYILSRVLFHDYWV